MTTMLMTPMARERPHGTAQEVTEAIDALRQDFTLLLRDWSREKRDTLERLGLRVRVSIDSNLDLVENAR